MRNTPASLWDAGELHNAVRATFGGQRGDGCMPDRVQSDGLAVYSPGGGARPFSDHAWDNMPFGAILLATAAEKFPADPASKQLFCDLEPAVS